MYLHRRIAHLPSFSKPTALTAKAGLVNINYASFAIDNVGKKLGILLSLFVTIVSESECIAINILCVCIVNIMLSVEFVQKAN